MKTTVIIKREDVWKEVETHSAYQAAKTSATYNRDRIKKSDRELFDIYFQEATNQLVQSFISFIREPELDEVVSRENNKDDYYLFLDISDFPEQLASTLSYHTTRVCIFYILARWLTMLGEGDETMQKAATDAADLCASNRTAIQRLIMRKKRPLRLKASPF